MDRILIKLWAMLASTAALFGVLIWTASTAFAQPGAVSVNLAPDDHLAEFVAAVQSVTDQYQVIPFTITSGLLPMPSLYAGSQPGLMTVATKYAQNPDLLESDFEQDVLYNYHSPGCDAQTYLGFHEAAHMIDYAHDRRARVTAWNWAGTVPQSTASQLSGYSFDSAGNFVPAEALAEAFAAVKCDPLGSTPAEHTLFEILVNTQ